jgi:hypothetical protein
MRHLRITAMTWATGEQYSTYGDHLLALVAQVGSRLTAPILDQRLIGIVCAATGDMLLATAPVVSDAEVHRPHGYMKIGRARAGPRVTRTRYDA